MNNIPLNIYVCVCIERDTHTHTHTHIYHIFFTLSSINGHLGYFHIMTIVNSAAVNIGGQVSLLEFSSFPGIYPGVGLLDHMVALFLVF